MAEATATYRNPKNDDVRVIPAELVKQYEARGWEKTTSAKAAKDTAGGK